MGHTHFSMDPASQEKKGGCPGSPTPLGQSFTDFENRHGKGQGLGGPTFRRMRCEMDALASMMMVDTLSSRISFSNGVGSRLSSNILTDSVSLEMRKPRTSSSNRSRPGEEGRVKAQKAGRQVAEHSWLSGAPPQLPGCRPDAQGSYRTKPSLPFVSEALRAYSELFQGIMFGAEDQIGVRSMRGRDLNPCTISGPQIKVSAPPKPRVLSLALL